MRLTEAEARLDEQLLELPNLPHPSVPVGKDDSENRVVREEGQKRTFYFTPLPHWDFGPRAGVIDFDRGVKVSGSRFYMLKGWGARLQRALITFMLDLHTSKHGYTEILPPVMVRRESLVGTGNLPKFGDNLYRDAVEDFWFIPTAEVPVTNLYRDEILDGAPLPIKHVAFTACFRREQMAAGRDTRGIKRGHQFDKVELVKFVRPETSMDELQGAAVRCRRRPQASRAALPGGPDVHRRPLVLGDGEIRSRSLGPWLQRVAGGQLLLELRRLPGAAGARSASSDADQQGEGAVRPHAQRLGPGAAAHADRACWRPTSAPTASWTCPRLCVHTWAGPPPWDSGEPPRAARDGRGEIRGRGAGRAVERGAQREGNRDGQDVADGDGKRGRVTGDG